MAAVPTAVALIRHKGTRPPTIAAIPRRLARTRRRLVLIPRRAALTRLLAVATVAAEALLMPALVGAPHAVAVEDLPIAVAAVDLLMAVGAVLTAIVKISAIQKGPPLFNQAGLLLF